MPELYLFGAIILGALMLIFWIVVTIATFINNAAERDETSTVPVASSKTKNQEWKYMAASDRHGFLQVEDDQIAVFGFGQHTLDNHITFNLYNPSRKSLVVNDVLLDGSSLYQLVPHHPIRENKEYMTFIMGILQEAVRAGTLPLASYEKAERTWKEIQTQDQLMRLGHISTITHDWHEEFIWKA